MGLDLRGFEGLGGVEVSLKPINPMKPRNRDPKSYEP